jgi:hypothetical protein
MTVDESRSKKDPGCTVLSYILYLLKARELNNEVGKMPPH